MPRDRGFPGWVAGVRDAIDVRRQWWDNDTQESDQDTMDSTSLSLLNRLRQSPDDENWNRLVTLYGPLLKSWLVRYDVQSADADDLIQDVLMAVSKGIAEFDHNQRPGAFRSWLRTILVNRLRGFWRARRRRPQVAGGSESDPQLAQLSDPNSDLSRLWNLQHDQHVARQLLELTKSRFAPATWEAFRRVAIGGEQADVVAAELGMSVNSVFIAKSRVLRRLREEADGLVESSSDFSVKC